MELILDKGLLHIIKGKDTLTEALCSGCYHVAIALDNASSKAVH